MHSVSKLALLAFGAALTSPGSAAAAPFSPPVPLPFAGSPVGSAIDNSGRSVLALEVPEGEERRAALALADTGQAPSELLRLGPSGVSDLELAANRQGASALTFSVQRRVYLTVCLRGECRGTQRVATAPLHPQSTVAVQPRTGRTTVMWRGRTRGGTRRLQWRITTNGKLGRTHTLREFGDHPRMVTDRSGKSVAIWRGREDRSLRTAARRVGEFTRPSTVATGPVAGQRLAVADNRFIAAWLSAPDGELPASVVQTSTRYDDSAFLTPQSIGEGSSVDVAAAPGGRALVSVLQIANDSRVAAATAGPFSRFTPLRDLGPAGLASVTRPPHGAIDDAGHVAVAYGLQTAVLEPAAATVVRGSGGAFGAPETLSGAAGGPPILEVLPAVGAGLLQLIYADRSGLVLRRASLR